MSWERDFGSLHPYLGEPSSTPLSPPLGDFTLPQVLSVEDAVEWKSGWILLDRRLGKLHFLNDESGLVRSVGGSGLGPGELQDPVSVTRGDSLVWVLNRRGRTLERFSEMGDFHDRLEIRGGACLVGLAKGMVFSPGDGLALLRVCPGTLPGPGTAVIERLGDDGRLHPVLSLPLGDAGSRRLHLLRTPAMTLAPSGFYLGTWDVPCVREVHRSGAPGGHRCLPDHQRPETRQKDRSRLESRFRRITSLGFLPLEVPDRYPWYDGLFSTPDGPVVRRIRGEEERDLVLLAEDGGHFVISSILPSKTFVGERTILTAEELLGGTRIRIIPNPWH